ncbi:MAG: MFS transporter [Actinobacteria bacterium HGW-Actinobacteria-5]|nr:MAG: MFS transporter [Actinobacteria bacterium HGW-Actinobacteria-5]
MSESAGGAPSAAAAPPRPAAGQIALALGLLLVELIAGIQTYLSQTVLPLMAAELNAQSLYGLVTATVLVANFAGLPLGLGLATRFRIPHLLVAFTLIISAGAIISALAPTIWWFLLGGTIRGFASGCIATVSMGAVVVGLPGRVRQITLSAMSAMWVIAAMLGPVYAAWISHALNWRWAMVIYLPVLLIARSIVARHLPDHDQQQQTQIGWRDSILLAAAMLLIASPSQSQWTQLATLAAGVALLIIATLRVLPAGTFRMNSKRRTVVAFMFGLCGLYFAVDSVVTIIAHDAFEADAGQIGMIIMAGGLTWAVVGLYCGWRPAADLRAYRRRASTGVALIAIGVLGMSTSANLWLGLEPTAALASGWAIAGVGMGLCYVDSLNMLFNPPDAPDGLTHLDVSNAAVMSESIAAAATTTIATTYLANSFGGSTAIDDRSTTLLIVIAVVTLALAIPLQRLSATSPAREPG